MNMIPSLQMQAIPHKPKIQVKPDVATSTRTDQMIDTNRQGGMYEVLQSRLGKTYLEIQRMIAAL
jgi:hypothetical protein